LGPLSHQPKRVRFVPVRRVGAAGIALSGLPSVLQEHDSAAHGTGGLQDAVRVRHNLVRTGDVPAAQIAVAALGGIAILQVDDDDGCPRRRKQQRFGPGLELDVLVVAGVHAST
jgi:hypothetical protein